MGQPSAELTDESALTRQPDEVIEQLREDRDSARQARDDARRDYDSAAHSIAYSALKGYDLTDQARERYEAAEQAVAATEVAFHRARVEWYHSMGKHASHNLTACCKPEPITPPEVSQ